MPAERTISMRKAIIIIAVSTIAFAAAGIALGYWWYIGRYDDRPLLEMEQEVFRAQVKKNPKDANALVNLGWSYYVQGNKDQALKEYQKALDIDRDNVNAIYNLGLMDMDSKDYDEAAQKMREVLKRTPGHQLASYTLAQIYHKTKQYDKARDQYLHVLKISPGSANIIVELGMVYEAQGKGEEAVQQYREALRYVPDLKEAKEGLERLEREKK